MLSLKLRRGLAGLGVFAIGGLGLLAPTAAMADPTTYVDPTEITISKTLISNTSSTVGHNYPAFGGVGFLFGFTIEPSPCSDDGCLPLTDYGSQYATNSVTSDMPAVAGNQASATATGHIGDAVIPSPDNLMNVGWVKAGVYQWKVREGFPPSGYWQGPPLEFWSTPVPMSYSQAEYLIRASVKEGTSGLEYNWITVIKLKNDDGTPTNTTNPDVGVKVDSIDFVNVMEDLGDLDVTKRVVNNSGVTEDTEPYDFTVVFTWPANFNGDVNTQTGKWTTTEPAIAFAEGSEHTNGSCAKNTTDNTTTCTFKLAATSTTSKTAKFKNVPAGATYTVTENRPSTAKYDDPSYDANRTGTIQARPMQWIDTDPSTGDDYGTYTKEECIAFATSNTNDLLAVKSWDAMNGCVVYGADTTTNKSTTTVTNTYRDVTPTGLALEYLPYVFMVVVPLAGVGAYIAMRRKLLS